MRQLIALVVVFAALVPTAQATTLVVTAASVTNPNGPVSNILDATSSTFWNCGGSGWSFPAYVTFDTGCATGVAADSFSLDPYAITESPKQFQLSSGASVASTSMVFDTTKAAAWDQQTSFALGSTYVGRYWRLDLLSSFDNYCPTLSSFQLSACPNNVCTCVTDSPTPAPTASPTDTPTAAPTPTASPTDTPTAAPTATPTVSTGSKAAQGAAVAAVVGASAVLSAMAGCSPTSHLQTLAVVEYSKDDPEARSTAGIMSPILFRLPTIDPLYPASGGSRRSETEEDPPSISLFGAHDLSVESSQVFAVMLGMTLMVYVAVFLLHMSSFNVHCPRPPDTPDSTCCSCKRLGDIVLCCVLGFEPLLEMLSCGSDDEEDEDPEKDASPAESSKEDPGGVSVATTKGDSSESSPPTEAWDRYGAAAYCYDIDCVIFHQPAPTAPDCSENSRATSDSQPAESAYLPSTRERLWPLGAHLLFEIGQAQYAGLAMALLFVVSLEDDSGDHTTGWAWVVTVVAMLGFPLLVFAMCWFAAPRVRRDRDAREQVTAVWAQCYDSRSGRPFYYDMQAEKSVWEMPPASKACAVHSIPLEIRWGATSLFEAYHGKNAISQFYPLIEIANTLTNVCMVMTVFWQGTVAAAWFLTGAKALDAALTTVGKPLIDTSDSQRNVENHALAGSLWVMAGSMAILAIDMADEDYHETLFQHAFLALSLSASMLVPVCCFIDKKCQPEAAGEEVTSQPEEPEQELPGVTLNTVYEEQKPDLESARTIATV